jgi:hypothetical protein
MAGNEKSVKINKKEKFIEQAEVENSDKKYDIEIREDNQETKFDELKHEKESKTPIKIKFREHGTTE